MEMVKLIPATHRMSAVCNDKTALLTQCVRYGQSRALLVRNGQSQCDAKWVTWGQNGTFRLLVHRVMGVLGRGENLSET